MHWVREVLGALVLALAIPAEGSDTLRSSLQAVSVLVVSFVDFGRKKDFSCGCSCFALLAYFIFSICFLPLEWLINACFPMLLSSKVEPHTVHLALWLSFSTAASPRLKQFFL